MELLEESGIAEIEVKEGEESIKLTKPGSYVQAPQQIIPTPAVNVGEEVITQEDSTQKDDNQNSKEEIDGEVITSPMVGTFIELLHRTQNRLLKRDRKLKKGILCVS